jgi:hypothetical protein
MRIKHAEFNRVVNIPIPDYSKIPPKVDCWRSKAKIDGEQKKVSVQ